MVEIVAVFVHLAPDAVRLAVFYEHVDLDAGVKKRLSQLVAEFGQTVVLGAVVTGYE